MKLRDPFAPELYFLNDTLLVMTFFQDASSIRIYNTNEGVMRSYNLRSKKDQVTISEDKNLNTSIHFLNNANKVYYDFIIEEGVMRIQEFDRLRIGQRSPYTAVKADKNTFIGLGNYKDGLFSIFDKEAMLMNYFGNYPLPDEHYLYTELTEYFRGYMDMLESEVLYAAANFGYISSYRYNNGKLRKNWERQVSDYIFEQKDMKLIFGEDHRNGFDGVKIGKNHIYALYNGHTQNQPGVSNSLLVFTHQGELVTRYNFPDLVEYFVIDEEEKNVYATYTPYMNESYLIKFRLFPDLSAFKY